MILAALLLLHGDDSLDLVYFWSSILIVLLPVGTFVVIAYLLIKGYRRRERTSTEHGAVGPGGPARPGASP